MNSGFPYAWSLRLYSSSERSLKTLKTTRMALPVSAFQSRTARIAISAASSFGKPKTPVEIQQKAMLSQPFSAASCRQDR